MELPKVKVADFEGPFDLLLHLIRKNKMGINNVKLNLVTNQYLEYLDKMKEMDLEVTSEFIVIAATLIEIKSKSLLPKIKDEIIEDDEDIEKRLLEKLLLYKKIKLSTEYFKKKANVSGFTYSKKPEIIEEIQSAKVTNKLLENISLIELYNIYNKLIENYVSKQNKSDFLQKRISVDKYKIEDKYDYLLELISNQELIKFTNVMKECDCKLECVVTFLALLELMKQRKIIVYQKENFSEIILKGSEIENV
ncbi:segregation/condensation protein A [Clostridium chrysemydis]|uniref:segregation/condensation protein A n=1 Tax=Clostridium chrysemydis TaxID=2665504 RepID=UPI0018835588|nr:segregation/condensation protein A [Clostridium chrysemydis]